MIKSKKPYRLNKIYIGRRKGRNVYLRLRPHYCYIDLVTGKNDFLGVVGWLDHKDGFVVNTVSFPKNSWKKLKLSRSM